MTFATDTDSPAVVLKAAKVFSFNHDSGAEVTIAGIPNSMVDEIQIINDDDNEAKVLVTIKKRSAPKEVVDSSGIDPASRDLLLLDTKFGPRQEDTPTILRSDHEYTSQCDDDIMHSVIVKQLSEVDDDPADLFLGDALDEDEGLQVINIQLEQAADCDMQEDSSSDDSPSPIKSQELMTYSAQTPVVHVKVEREDDDDEAELEEAESERHYCKLCGKTYQSMVALIRHHKAAHGRAGSARTRRRGNQSWHCTAAGCGETFHSKVAFNQHQRDVHSAPLHQCNLCSERFQRRADLVAHYKVTHPDQELIRCPFICPSCGAAFEVKQRLEKHYRETHERKIDKQECKHCHKIIRKENMKMHMSRHTGRGMYKCSVCDMAFGWRGSVRQHQRKVHGMFGGIEAHECEVCEKNFKDKGTLKQHMMIHTGVKTFCCESCGAKFARKGDLKKHEEIIHQGIRRYRCTVCNKGFAATETLTAHMNAHKGLKPFRCDSCENTFASKGHLKRHIRNVHVLGQLRSEEIQDSIRTLSTEVLEEITVPDVPELQTIDTVRSLTSQDTTDADMQYALIYIDGQLAKNAGAFGQSVL